MLSVPRAYSAIRSKPMVSSQIMGKMAAEMCLHLHLSSDFTSDTEIAPKSSSTIYVCVKELTIKQDLQNFE
ncbi:hypothetical protein CEXT_255971 [Caerostris extrusa]|uniref:Uncharacterized protein n=1 Tax=Caerostris extrusa TaxID=172846 RepID=A0AAV4WIC3_CAEEX|nr:hypothetical protein CEXT_255971 [Caerostris extrusa]